LGDFLQRLDPIPARETSEE